MRLVYYYQHNFGEDRGANSGTNTLVESKPFANAIKWIISVLQDIIYNNVWNKYAPHFLAK